MQLGHRVLDTGTVGAGTLLANTTWQADVMVAALVSGRSSRQRFGTVGVEIGIALERGLPILLVAKAGLSLPFLTGIPRIDLADDEHLLATQLDLLLQAVEEGSPRQAAWSSRPTSARAVRATDPRSAGQAQDFELRVGSLLKATGAEVIEHLEFPQGANQPDFAIYFAKFGRNPGVVLVEAKSLPARGSHKGSKSLLAEAAKKLSARVLASRAGLGLLIYEGSVVTPPRSPMTVVISVDELEHRLSRQSLEDWLLYARNEAIHKL